MTAHVAEVRIYPVKSLPGTTVSTADVRPSGALALDRRWALRDEQGRFWNAKRTAAMHQFRCQLELDPLQLTVSTAAGLSVSWSPGRSVRDLESFFTSVLGSPVSWVEDDRVGFPDDLESPGPTLVSTASLRAMASWFPGLTEEQMRQRLRANIEVDGVPPFWEDQLFRGDGQPQPFRIGDVLFAGTTPCQRCVVPSRDAQSGEIWPRFQIHFAQQREKELPEWAPRERFNHFYRATVNTRLLQDHPGRIQAGDAVSVVALTDESTR